ncbi:unnamed protein product [Phytomonas sp. Hart1]|nr:unnamed protein product [Phytomonas sp. Hart1]|eukprot:CCW71052.1 unnamed protein product [Phytomonas sp. isolate Hart1]
MNPYTQISVALLMIAVNLYWIAALFIIFLRANEPHFQVLSQYSGRLTSVASYASGAKKTEKKFCLTTVDVPVQGRARGDASAAQATPCKASNNAMQHVGLMVNWVRDSALGRVWVGRRNSFCIFYLSGIFTCAGLWTAAFMCSTPSSLTKSNPAAPLRIEASLPLLAFSIHVLVRLVECLILQEFRDQKEDRMLLFATLAGSSFYIFVPLSSNGLLIYFISLWSYEAPPGRTSKDLQSDIFLHFSTADPFEFYISSRLAQLLMWSLFITHILVQLLQVLHHRILSELRRSSPSLSKGDLSPIVFSAIDQFSTIDSNILPSDHKDTFREIKDKTNSGCQQIFQGLCGSKKGDFSVAVFRTGKSPNLLIKSGVSDHRVWTYRFPQRLLFPYVQEPHYSCEIVMYVINLMEMLVLFLSLFPRRMSLHTSGKSTYIPIVPREPFCPLFSVEHIAWMQLSAALLVGLFTLCNLAITSSEHQMFWLYLNSTRKFVRCAINQLRDAKQQTPRQDTLSCDKSSKTVEKFTQNEAVPKWRLFTFIY